MSLGDFSQAYHSLSSGVSKSDTKILKSCSHQGTLKLKSFKRNLVLNKSNLVFKKSNLVFKKSNLVFKKVDLVLKKSNLVLSSFAVRYLD